MKYSKPIIIAILFPLIQAVLGTAFGLCAQFTGNPSLSSMSNLVVLMLLCDMLIVAIAYGMGMLRTGQMFRFRAVRWQSAPLVIAASLLAIFGLNILSEFAELEDLLAEQMKEIMRMPHGIVAIAIAGPITEEIVFREAMIGTMLRNGVKPIVAILLSGLCFGIVHGNPAQVPFALCIGSLLGYVYVRSGNIVLTSIIHILNNSLAVVQFMILGDRVDDFRLTDFLGGTLPSILVATLCISISLLILYRTRNSDIQQ